MKITARSLVFDVIEGGPPDGPPVLLLHGFPQHSGEWAAVTPLLHAAGLRTYALDQRGTSPGARPSEVEAYRITECALDAVAVLDELGIPAVHLVGHDWGAICAWHVALRHPARVRTLTAVSVPHPHATARAYLFDADQRERSAYIKLFRQPGKAEEVLLADDARRMRALFAGSGLTDEGVDQYVRPLQEPGALTAALNWYRAMNPKGDLIGIGRCHVPTTYVWSDDDLAIGATAARGCASHVAADYRFVPLPGVSHWIPDQVPGAVADAIIARCMAVATGG
ncbi:alpha/beta hydrolase [Dactylosporangium sp. AC04546]|uniref:alpha/beta fold hydrolase n=1 Tax=Dactylosporangium sp. AC04546 TaxID=2862460 RepID=UPI001EE0E358|nr:alpha/beta hydrolase [Dactylosporangium sp. AC04546]WVK82542.1 alpha/beta hydrolase [Dactylosporangium sp. AC04546]